MSVTISDKAIILTDYKDLLALISGILPDLNITFYSENSSLSSIDELKNITKQIGNLSFIKKDILSFVENNGYPFILVIDMKINTGLESDNDNIKVLKTFLLSYIVIMQSEQYKNISCNIAILSDKAEYSRFKQAHKQPQDILGILKTNDERLNNIIHEYTTNNEKFKRNFNILLTDAGQPLSLIKSELVLFFNMIKAKEKLKSKLIKEKPASVNGPKINAALSADVVLRIGENIFKNGNTQELYNEVLNLTEKEIYILGNFTSFTRLEVIEKLLNLIKTGFGNDLNFKKGDALILNIPKDSIIDSTTPITLAQLLSKDLIDYKNVKIKITPVHHLLMQQSKGFSMIQKNLVLHN